MCVDSRLNYKKVYVRWLGLHKLVMHDASSWRYLFSRAFPPNVALAALRVMLKTDPTSGSYKCGVCTVWLNGVSSSTTEPSTRQSGPPLAWTLLDTQLSMGWGLLRRWGSWGTVRVPGVNIVVRIEEPVRSSDSSANKDCSTNGLFWGHCFDVFAEGDILCEPRVRFYSSLLLECRLLLRVDCYNRSGLWDVKVFPIACGTGFLCRGMSLNAKP